ncbi:MAG: sporulation integral membrane protein YlbJ [Gracilibacteraceae bacterium]|jgi:sporulation integral membrane protein YlbJ|nr:sporulation integral membrane protein YlbJ [Gracilibacteraceae bacterium]
MKRISTSTFAFSIIFCILVFFIIKYPGEAFTASLDGLMLWFNVVCPALLPFFICVEILIGLGIVSLFGSVFRPLMSPVFNVPGEGSFNFFMSISSGYPVGAKIAAELRNKNLCSLAEGQRLLSFCSTSGPLFIIGAVATGIMNNPALGFFLALAHYLSAITAGLFMRFYGKEKTLVKRKYKSDPIAEMMEFRIKDGRTFGVLMKDAVKNGIDLILTIGGFIIFFSVITGMLKISGFLPWFSTCVSGIIPNEAITPDMISSVLTGFLEVTNGAKACASLHIPLIYKTVIISFMIGFGGLSVNAQVMSIISETDLKFGIYFIVKLLQGFAAAFYSYILITCCSNLQVFNLSTSADTIMQNAFIDYSFLRVFTSSSVNMAIILLFMSAVTIMKNKKHILHI